MARVYLRDLRTKETKFLSRLDGPTGVAADGPSSDPAIDAAGDVVAFASTSPNLGTGKDLSQVFVRDVANSKTELVSRPVSGDGAPAEADSPTVDASGNRVTFIAFGGVESPPTSNFGAYVRDRAAGTTTLVSRADGAGGATADSDVSAASISGSGACVAFTGPFTNIGDGFASPDFSAVHLRAVSGPCPGAEPTTARDGGAQGGQAGGGPAGGGQAGSDGPAGPGKPGDTGSKAPVLTGLKLSPSRLRKGRRSAIVFTLTSAARVTVKFELLTKGRARRAGSLTISGRAGNNKFKFSGKLRGKFLKTGRYRLTATPRLGTARTTKFVVVATPKKRR